MPDSIASLERETETATLVRTTPEFAPEPKIAPCAARARMVHALATDSAHSLRDDVELLGQRWPPASSV
jgi:hypothetical protein